MKTEKECPVCDGTQEVYGPGSNIPRKCMFCDAAIDTTPEILGIAIIELDSVPIQAESLKYISFYFLVESVEYIVLFVTTPNPEYFNVVVRIDKHGKCFHNNIEITEPTIDNAIKFLNRYAF